MCENWESYQMHHMVALVTFGVGAGWGKSKKKNDLIAQVKALYAQKTSSVV